MPSFVLTRYRVDRSHTHTCHHPPRLFFLPDPDIMGPRGKSSRTEPTTQGKRVPLTEKGGHSGRNEGHPERESY